VIDYCDAITVGIDFTARDVQNKLKEKGLPWEKAKAFDNAAILGEWRPLTPAILAGPIHYTLSKNGSTVQSGDSSLMIFPLDKILAGITEYFTIHPGDLIYTGTPAGVGPTSKGDVFEGFFEGQSAFILNVNP
jgi:2-keto-4-pentenoate hydratase/2-oxohepta-3-ene-1,7-dioic acid hydratase in catechol pathway